MSITLVYIMYLGFSNTVFFVFVLCKFFFFLGGGGRLGSWGVGFLTTTV